MSTAADPHGAKQALRTSLAARRHRRPAAERAAAAAALASTLLHALAHARTFAAYVPDEAEPGHGRLPAAYTQLGARVLLPIVQPESLELLWAVDTGRLAPGRFGQLEPVGPRLAATAIGTADIIVLPALAVARDGIRLGRGGGYYDRALRHARPGAVRVALLFDDELLDELPAEPHDERVTAVITPSGGWHDLGSAPSVAH